MLNLEEGRIYIVTSKRKLHTKPLYETEINRCGRFMSETAKMLIFDSFAVCKKTVTDIIRIEVLK